MPKELVSALITASAGFIGLVIGVWFTSRNQRIERKHRFLSEQLTELYGPMHAMRMQLSVRRATELKLKSIAGREWARKVDKAQAVGFEALQEATHDGFAPYAALIDYDNQQLESEINPIYQRMDDLFIAKFHLTEASTRQYLPALSEFVDIRKRYMRKSIPIEVVVANPPDEALLQPLYADLQKNFERLQDLMKDGQ